MEILKDKELLNGLMEWNTKEGKNFIWLRYF